MSDGIRCEIINQREPLHTTAGHKIVMHSGDSPSQGGWVIDRHIPVALIGAVMVQTVVGIIAAANLWFRVTDLEKTASLVPLLVERVTRLEERFAGIQDGIKDIKIILLRPGDPHRQN